MQVYLSVTPDQLHAAAMYNRNLVHVAYRIGTGSCLLCQSLPQGLRGGLLSLSDADAPPISEPDRLSASLVQECQRRNYQGVLLDFESSPSKDRLRLVHSLSQALGRGRSLYLPPSYHDAAPEAPVLLNTALSGGTLQDLLRSQGPAKQHVLDVERLRMDFLLPAPSGQGTPLSAEAFRTLREQLHPTIFFSQELCVRYFTYLRKGRLHLVLFDDAETIRRKLQIGSSLGFPCAFLMYPEVSDLLPSLFPGTSGFRRH